MTLQESLRDMRCETYPDPKCDKSYLCFCYLHDKAADALDAKDARIKELEGALRDEAMSQLPELMSDISEEHWAAGWMSGTEHRLWDFMTNEADDGEWGMVEIDPKHRARLKLLSDRCGGWFDDRDFVPIDDWIRARAALGDG